MKYHPSIYKFANQIKVICPDCNKLAFVEGESKYLRPWKPKNTKFTCPNCATSKSSGVWNGPIVLYAKTTCGKCGFHPILVNKKLKSFKNFKEKTQTICPQCDHKISVKAEYYMDYFNGEPIDPFFGFDLYFQIPFGDKILWAYNLEHLKYLIDYVSSDLREHEGNSHKYTIANNLPKWYKSKRNREKIVKLLNKLLK